MYCSSFSFDESAKILEVGRREFDELARTAFAEISGMLNGSVLILEDEPIIAMDLEQTVRDIGLSVVDVAATQAAAVASAVRNRPDLILTDIQLADGFSGTNAAIEIVSKIDTRIVFITAFPEQLLIGHRPDPTYLITKPFQRETVRHTIIQSLLMTEFAPEEPHRHAQQRLAEVEPLAPQAAPIDAIVTDNQLRLRKGTLPQSRIASDTLESLRAHHREAIEAFLRELAGKNSAPSLWRRLSELARLLAEPLTEGNALAVGVSVDGLVRLAPTIREQLMDVDSSDLFTLLQDLQSLSEQFPVYRLFREEALSAKSLGEADEVALQEIVGTLVAMPDEIVEPALKNSLNSLSEAGTNPLSDAAKLRSVANVLKAVAREVKLFAKEVGSDSRKRAIAGLGFLVVALPTGTALTLLGASYPIEFGLLAGILSSAATAIRAQKDAS